MTDRRVPDRGLLSRRPLTASKADQALFVNRDSEIATILSAIKLRVNTFVSGPPGSGKTSLLRHVQRTLEDSDAGVEYVNVEVADSSESAIGLIAQALAPDGLDRTPVPLAADETDLSAIEGAVAARDPNEALVLLVDGIEESMTAVLFGRYRDRLWETPNLVWVVASRHVAPAPPADAFFDRVVELAPFTQADGSKLLAQWAAWISADTRHRLAEAIGAAQPVQWMLAAQSLALADVDADRVIEALADQRDASQKLPERLRVLYDALLALGPVHAGDTELLSRVGASRPWVVTSLKELEERGLVHSEREGRRVLYEALRNWLVHSSTSSNAGSIVDEWLTQADSL